MVKNKKIVSPVVDEMFVYNWQFRDDCANDMFKVYFGSRDIDDRKAVHLIANDFGLEVLCSPKEYEVNCVKYDGRHVNPGQTFFKVLSAVASQYDEGEFRARVAGNEIVFQRGVEHGKEELRRELKHLLNLGSK